MKIHTHNNQANGNLKSLQILRFIAATSVAYLHIFVNPNFGSFGVDIFFVLSGFVIALVVSNKQSAKVFAISRLTRIVPLYWLLTTLLLFVIFFIPQYVHEATVASATFINYLKSLFFIPYFDAVKLQLQSSFELQEVNIIAAPTNYAGITLLDLDESAVSTLSSIRNIEALLLDEEVAAKLKQSSTADETLSFKSLDGVAEREQYEHLSQLLHIQKATRDKR